MKRINAKNLSGILVFLISLITYMLTLEPTNSFWDCSEFLTCAYGLEVGHAPGAPVFMLLGRLFGLLASEPQQIAYMINTLSAVSSALTVMILFFTITIFAEKIRVDHTKKKHWVIIASGFIGALTYAFSDSFWFSAVEAEVYATSSLFTALVFWAALKYSQAKVDTLSYRWIILIFFILGLSVGIHLLNLLTLPAMALLVYFKHYKPIKKGIIFSIILSIVLLVFFIYGIIPGLVKLIAFSDRVFVNIFHLPRYSGAFLFLMMFSALLFLAHRYFDKRNMLIQQVMILSFTFWMIGYSSFTILVIRSNQNPFVDINNVENIYGLVDYLNREQYPSRPIMYGNNYNSTVVKVNKRTTYKYHDGKYHKDELNPSYEFDKNTKTLFPRMASMDKRHVDAYKQWVDIKGRKVQTLNARGEKQFIQVPTFRENMRFFIRYQLNHMYLRYFMWNFAGKQNDIQGRGESLHGNWISGIPIIDDLRLGDQKLLPDYYKNHASRNRYFMLPLFLGLFGLFYQFTKDKKHFWVNVLLFFFTGIAIVLYLNEVPITPRERDYVHVGSFYVFAIWIGLGVLGLLRSLEEYTRSKIILTLLAIVLFAVVPLNMLKENWDDHNRSNRFTANAFGENMLDSCEENAILFTTADNDTYPLWYLQEVENYRPDIRNVLLTFLPVDWYADQLHHEHYEKGKVAVSFKGEELLMNKNQYFPVVNRIDSFIDVTDVMDFVKNPSDKTKLALQNGDKVNFIPGNKLDIKVNASNFLKTCSYLQNSNVSIPATIKFTCNEKYLGRDALLMLDIIAQNNWERPLYFIYPEIMEKLGLGEYLHREGMLYRFMPFTQQEAVAFIKERSQNQYELMNQQFKWGNVNEPSVYLDHTNIQNIGSFRLRQIFIESANMLIQAKEQAKAVELLDKVQMLLPPERVPYSWFIPEMVKAYKRSGADDKANVLAKNIGREMEQRYVYYQSFDSKMMSSTERETLYIMQQMENMQ